jgi:ADP-ribose pyrophosphatase YjhB (NUDIX family)
MNEPINTFAAGILITSPKGILLLKRGEQQDHPNEWSIPGGHIEAGESPQVAAVRELFEETGIDGISPDILTPRSIIDGFVTYSVKINNAPDAIISDESSEWGWFERDALPDNCHPGLIATLGSDPMSDTQCAEYIASGALTSPQWYSNMMLYALRITGTGVTWRGSKNEYAYRVPENYLTADFLERCKGLPVIFIHPEKGMLSDASFSDQIVGTTIYAYIVDSDVWAIARVYDADTIKILANAQMSTSPSIITSTIAENAVNIDGTPVIIEGKPTLIDHIAIVPNGVWDKLGAPDGILQNEVIMEPEDKKEDALKNDAQPGATPPAADPLSQILSKLDELGGRITKLEGAENKESELQKDAQPEGVPPVAPAGAMPEPTLNADAEEKLRNEMSELKARVDAQTAEVAPEEANAIADAQIRADSVANLFGERAPMAQRGESALAYRKRLALKYQKYSPRAKDIDIASITNSGVLAMAEERIYTDAQVNATSIDAVGAGNLREVRRADQTGRLISEFHGDPSVAFAPWKLPARRATFAGNK